MCGRAAVLGNGHHRRLARFVDQIAGQRADQNPRRAYADDGAAVAVERAEMIGDVVEGEIGALHPLAQPVNLRAAHSRRDARRAIHAAGAKHDDRNRSRHCQTSARRCTRIIEK